MHAWNEADSESVNAMPSAVDGTTIFAMSAKVWAHDSRKGCLLLSCRKIAQEQRMSVSVCHVPSMSVSMYCYSYMIRYCFLNYFKLCPNKAWQKLQVSKYYRLSAWVLKIVFIINWQTWLLWLMNSHFIYFGSAWPEWCVTREWDSHDSYTDALNSLLI